MNSYKNDLPFGYETFLSLNLYLHTFHSATKHGAKRYKYFFCRIWRKVIIIYSVLINAGGMILLNKGGGGPLQYVANSAFLANLFADYLTASSVPGFYCGPNYIPIDAIRSFATSQVNSHFFDPLQCFFF